MSCVMIENLESRSLLSAAPVSVHVSPAGAIHTALQLHAQAKTSLVPADFLQSYGGSFLLVNQNGYASLNVTSHKGNTCTGTISFFDYSGDTITSGRVTFTFGRNTVLGNLKMIFKTRNSTLTGTGSYHSGDPGFSLLFKGGKFAGAKGTRFTYSEVAFMKGLDVF